MEEVNESDDEEIDEDEAFNSEDERKYGSFFENDEEEEEGVSSGSAGDEHSEVSDSDDEESSNDEGDGGQYMLNLLEKIGEDKLPSETTDGTHKIAINVKESEHAASVIPSAKVTLDSLMSGLQDTEGFGVMQKKLKAVAQGRATSTPLSRVVSERTKRKLQYETEKKDVSKWLDIVQDNRKAETLDFRPKDRIEVTKDDLVEKFVPTTDFEKELHEAIQHAGQLDEEEILKREEEALKDDLGMNEITMDDYKRRHGELAKMRALMFYHEQKRHHMKKIKSKKYRKIRKKQRLREKENELELELEDNPDLARELQEKEEVERMKERMTLAHKNTSKWAKRILKRGKNVDVDTRRALSAQLKRGDDLLKKMTTTNIGQDDSESDEDLTDTARRVLESEETNGDREEQPKGIFKLAFMQRGLEKEKELAREEARQLLMELEGDGQGSDLEADDIEKKPTIATKPNKKASNEEMKTVLGDRELVAASLRFGGGNSVSVSGPVEVQVNEPAKGHYKAELFPAAGNETKPPTADSNPWVSSVASEPEVRPSRKIESRNVRRPQSGLVNVEEAANVVATNNNSQLRKDSISSPGKKDKKIATMTQEELVQRAFAAPSEAGAEEEFATEKSIVEEEEEDGAKKKGRGKGPETVTGWGSWTGAGAPPPKPPKRLPRKLRPPEKTLSKRKRTDAKRPNVIISEKRVKRTADKFMISEVPYPYTSREEYERSMTGGAGKEWNVTSSHKDLTRPEVLTKAGFMIKPLSKKAKKVRPAAKF